MNRKTRPLIIISTNSFMHRMEMVGNDVFGRLFSAIVRNTAIVSKRVLEYPTRSTDVAGRRKISKLRTPTVAIGNYIFTR